ncbi:MAG: hypothetical protein AAFQ82_02510 [Myxococcota bacterium]
MAGESPSFEQACDVLEHNTSLTRPQVRGAVRLALKEGGLRPTLVGARQLTAVAKQLLPSRLVAQGLSEGEAAQVCELVVKRLESAAGDQPDVGPGMILNRLDKARRDS